MIVGRDPDKLDEAGVSRAAIESLAENFSDGIVAPAFWLGAGGLVGGVAYKAANTADSMIGHRTPRHEAFGWAAARFDDLINLPASRLTALLIVIAAYLVKDADPKRAWHAVRRDAGKHRSPNAGWPEAAMAGALGLALAGPRAYGGVVVEDAFMGEGGKTRGDQCRHQALRSASIGWPTRYLIAAIRYPFGARTCLARLRTQNSMPCCAFTPAAKWCLVDAHFGHQICCLDQRRLGVAAGDHDMQPFAPRLQRRDHLVKVEILVAQRDVQLVEHQQADRSDRPSVRALWPMPLQRRQCRASESCVSQVKPSPIVCQETRSPNAAKASFSPGMPGTLDELDDTDPLAVAKHAQGQAEGGRRLALARAGVDDQQALLDRLLRHLCVLHRLALSHLGAVSFSFLVVDCLIGGIRHVISP